MENKKYLIGNMKMNFSFEDVERYFHQLKQNAHNKQVIFCPTSLYVTHFIEQGYETGIQNVSEYEQGAYTGEVSPMQAASIGCRYVILGHSERRICFNETNDIVKRKVAASLKHGLNVVLCIGESLEEMQEGETKRVLEEELREVFEILSMEDMKHIIVAYEPIWAIGTGKIPTVEQIDATARLIKEIVAPYGIEDIPVLYGGSVNGTNICQLNTIESLSGFLVGGACLKPEEFTRMIEVVL